MEPKTRFKSILKACIFTILATIAFNASACGGYPSANCYGYYGDGYYGNGYGMSCGGCRGYVPGHYSRYCHRYIPGHYSRYCYNNCYSYGCCYHPRKVWICGGWVYGRWMAGHWAVVCR